MPIYNIDELSTQLKDWPQRGIKTWPNGREQWVLARPLDGPFRWRLKAAWLVLTGKADALTWTEQ